MHPADERLRKLLTEIDELRSLGPGWDSYGASPIAAAAIQAAKDFVTRYSVAPTVNGGVSLEVIFGQTERGGFQFSVGFDADGKVVEFWTSYEDGYAVKPQPKEVWYGLCGYWTDDWSKLASTDGQGRGIPLCPVCGAVGFQQSIDEWWARVDAHEAAGNPGYRKEIEALKDVCGKKINAR